MHQKSTTWQKSNKREKLENANAMCMLHAAWCMVLGSLVHVHQNRVWHGRMKEREQKQHMQTHNTRRNGENEKGNRSNIQAKRRTRATTLRHPLSASLAGLLTPPSTNERCRCRRRLAARDGDVVIGSFTTMPVASSPNTNNTLGTGCWELGADTMVLAHKWNLQRN